MKMIVAIINDAQSEAAAQALLENDFRVTRLASTGGLLRGGTTTLMVGVADDKVETALSIIREQIPAQPDKIQATIYIVNIREFARV